MKAASLQLKMRSNTRPLNLINENLTKQIIQWGRQTLSSHGYALRQSAPELVQNTPWSYVVRFLTSDGYIYLKHTPPMLALEPHILQLLQKQFKASVPEVIAYDNSLYCFLMKDAGRPLREILKTKFDVLLLGKAIEKFSSLQLAVADHVRVFLTMGVPDWRLEKLPNLYQQLLLETKILMDDGLTDIDMKQLENLLPMVIHLCAELVNIPIKQTITQCDFHDNNILINSSQHITFIDLGEIVISHPLFSLVGCLRQVKKHHAIVEDDVAYEFLLNSCCENYLSVLAKKDFFTTFATAKILWIVYEALAQYRLRMACDEKQFLTFQTYGKLAGALKEFINACK